MTRDEFESALHTLMTTVDLARYWEIRDDLIAHEAGQRATIAREHATNEYLASTIRKWEAICQEQAVTADQQAQEIARLREAVQIALISLRAWNGDETWPLYKQSPEIQKLEQAIKESPSRQ